MHQSGFLCRRTCLQREHIKADTSAKTGKGHLTAEEMKKRMLKTEGIAVIKKNN